MEQPVPTAPDINPPDEFDLYWQQVIVSSGYQVVIVEPELNTQPSLAMTEEPIGFHHLQTIIGSPNVSRLPLRALYGVDAHVYALGFWDGDTASQEAFDAAPINPHIVELAARHDLDAIVRGRVVIVTRDAIDTRDLHPALIEHDAETMPDIERDYERCIGGAAAKEWGRLMEALEGKMIPSMLQTAPSMDRIAWLIRTLLVGLDTDIVSHAAMHELCAKQPFVGQAMLALWNIQASYFSGRFSEPAPDDDDEARMIAPPKADKPAGYSERHGKVLH